jgi:hypothetical protein
MTAPRTVAALPLLLDHIARLVKARGFELTGLGDRLVISERAVPQRTGEYLELVFHRLGVGDSGWTASLFRRTRLPTIDENDIGIPVGLAATTHPITESALLLTTCEDAGAWLDKLRLEGLI